MALVKYNAKNVYTCCNVRLLPGVNIINDVDLQQASLVPLFKWRVDNSIIEIIDEKKSKNKNASKKKIIEHVDSIYDVKLLKSYIEQSDDKKLAKAAKEQLEKIEAEPVKEKDGVTVK